MTLQMDPRLCSLAAGAAGIAFPPVSRQAHADNGRYCETYTPIEQVTIHLVDGSIHRHRP